MPPDRLRKSDSRALAREARSRRVRRSWKTRSRSSGEATRHRNKPAEPARLGHKMRESRDFSRFEHRKIRTEVCPSGSLGPQTPAPGNLIRFVEYFHGAGQQENLEAGSYAAHGRTGSDPFTSSSD